MKLYELAALIRSKNAGPFELTFDVMFDNEEAYQHVVNNNIISRAWIAQVYGVPEEDVQLFYYGPARAIKATIPRSVPSGHPFDTDVYGGQQYAPFVDLEIPPLATSETSTS
jgi:hypothetical protein